MIGKLPEAFNSTVATWYMDKSAPTIGEVPFFSSNVTQMDPNRSKSKSCAYAVIGNASRSTAIKQTDMILFLMLWISFLFLWRLPILHHQMNQKHK